MKKTKLILKPGEEFKRINEYYWLSNYGRFYSAKSKRILKQEDNLQGYPRFRIIRKWTLTHIKVVELFGDRLGNRIPDDVTSLRELKLSIDHVDGNKRNNHYSNLEIVTHSENCLRRNRNMRGEKVVINSNINVISVWDYLT